VSAPAGLDPIDDPSWLGEELCGLPEGAVDDGLGLLGLIPGISHWLNSTAATTGGKIVDVIVGGAGTGLLGMATGAILHVPLLGSVLDFLASKGLKKATGIDFSLKDSVNHLSRLAGMAIEGKATGRRQGAAVLKAQVLMGKLGDLGQKLTSK
jgi:hypothetical protein